jgi:hemerythrin-like domain-containing protein
MANERHDDITATLIAQHDTMRSLIGRMRGDIDPSAKLGILHGLRDMWVWHGDAEEETLYARMRAKGEAKREVTEGKAEHDQGRVLFEAMSRIDTSDRDFVPRFEALAEVVEHHLDEEEEELFVEARQELSDDESADLAARFTNRYRTFELQNNTVDELRTMATDMEIHHPSSLNKDELVAAIQGTVAARA